MVLKLGKLLRYRRYQQLFRLAAELLPHKPPNHPRSIGSLRIAEGLACSSTAPGVGELDYFAVRRDRSAIFAIVRDGGGVASAY